MFLYTSNGYVSISHVARVETAYKPDGRETNTFYSAGGDVLGTTDDPDFDIQTLTAPVVPAAADAVVVLIHRPHRNAGRPSPEDVWAETVPVLAWRVLSCGAIPITFDDEDLRVARVLHPLPDGRFLAPGDQVFPSVEDAVTSTLRDALEAWDCRHGAVKRGITP